MTNLKQILLEFSKLEEKLPPDLQKMVGNVFLGSDPVLQKIQKADPEDNTKWENDLYDKLVYWINSPNTVIANFFSKNKDLIIKLAKEFPTLLMPPIGKLAYRGTRVKLDSLEMAFKTKKFKVVRVAGREVFHFKNLAYNPNRDSQSWSVDPKVAFRFTGRGEDGSVAVVYVTKVNRDFLFNPNLLNVLWKSQGGSGREDETVRVAKSGVFEAFVSTGVLYNDWELSLKDNFVHKLPSTAPYFKVLLDKYNKDIDYWNRNGENYDRANSVEDIISMYGVDEYGFTISEPDGSPWTYNDLVVEYSKAVKKYIKLGK